MATKVIFLTSGTSWTVPSDCTMLDKVECIGAGGSGTSNNGAGGAVYAAIQNLGVTPGSAVAYSVGVAAAPSTGGGKGGDGGPTWFGSTSTVYAQGGFGPANNVAGNAGQGGSAASSVGSTKFSGGAGVLYNGFGGGGGGAAGPSGAGGPGVANTGTGGTANGGTAAANTSGAIWTSTHAADGFTASVATAGPGGGGTNPSANTNLSGQPGKNYGGGATGGGFNGFGGTGAQGIIVLTYTSLNFQSGSGSAAGIAIALATGRGVKSASGITSGVGSAAAVAGPVLPTGRAAGLSDVAAIGRATSAGIGASTGLGTADGRNITTISGVGATSGLSNVHGGHYPPSRIILGRLPSDGYGLRISEPGYNASSQPVDETRLFFSSEWPDVMPIHQIGSAILNPSLTVNSAVTQLVDYPTLGFVPFVEFYVQSRADALPAGSSTFPASRWYNYATMTNLYISAVGDSYLRLNISATQLRLECYARFSGSSTFGAARSYVIYWVIYRRQAL